MRLQVFLSRNGVCSRRKALDLIKSGAVTVNGQPMLEPSYAVNEDKDKVTANGKEVEVKRFEYILLHKPAGCVTTKSDKHAEKTVIDLLPKKYSHLVPVGRLDKNTEGLLLLTNDGDLTFGLTHPRFKVDKTYSVVINGRFEPKEKNRLEKGVVIDGQKTAPASIKNIKYDQDRTDFLITIHEGKKRQIRMMLEKVGHKVIYLKRITQGPLQLGTLKKGQWRLLTQPEISGLKKAIKQK